MRRRLSWTTKNKLMLQEIINICESLKQYLPLTLRQVYYQLVSKEIIENKVAQYQALSRLLKYARIDGLISWSLIEDRVRKFHDLTGWTSLKSYIDSYVYHIKNNYNLNLLQDQDVYLECWIEKDALSTLFTKATSKYCVPVVVCRGFASVSFLNEFKKRLEKNDDKTPIMLYFGDFDPSGMAMLESMKETLEEEMGVYGVEFERITLTEDDVDEYNLPHNPNACKKSDSRYEKHIEQYGELAVELDALPPDVLVKKIEESIACHIDFDKFEKRIKQEKKDQIRLDKWLEEVKSFKE